MTRDDPRLAEAIAEAEAVGNALREAYPDLADDERAFADTFEGLSSALDVAAALMSRALDRERFAEDAERQVADLKAREARFRRQAELYRAGVARIMAAAGVKRLETAAFDVGLRKGGVRVDLHEPDRIPAEFMRAPPPPEPDKARIRAALMGQGSQAVPGARLVEGAPFLQVKRT